MATTVRKTDREDGDRYPGAVDVADVNYETSTALYGRSGSGKTTLAATWPKPILYLNIKDNGTDSISDVEGVDVVHINSGEELKDLILWCARKASKGKLKYRTVILDTMTQLQSLLTVEKGVNSKLKKSTGKKRPGDYGTLTRQDWGEIAGDLKAVIMDIRNLPMHSVFIAQERVFNAGDEEDDGADQLVPEVGTRLMPSVNSDLCASVTIVGNCFVRLRIEKVKDPETKKTTRQAHKDFCLRVGPNEVYTTKIRKPKGIKAPDYITDPTFKKIKAIMKGN